MSAENELSSVDREGNNEPANMSQSSQIDEVLDQNLPREENNDTDNEEESDENDEIPDEYEVNSDEDLYSDDDVVESNLDIEIANLDRMNGEGNFSDYEEPATANTIAEDEGPSLIEKSKQKYGDKKVAVVAPSVSDVKNPFKRLHDIKIEYYRELTKYYQQFGMAPPPSQYLHYPWKFKDKETGDYIIFEPVDQDLDVNDPMRETGRWLFFQYLSSELGLSDVAQYIHDQWKSGSYAEQNVTPIPSRRYFQRQNHETDSESSDEDDQNEEGEERNESNRRKRKHSETDYIDMTADGKIKAYDDVIDALHYLNQDCNKYDIRMMFTCARKLMELNGFGSESGEDFVSVPMLQELSRIVRPHV